MKTLYLLTEDNFDSLIYEACVERITGTSFTPVCRRMRKGSGLGAVRASLQLAIAEISRLSEGSGVHFVVAMDNDRAPHSAASDALSGSERAKLANSDARKSDRYADLVTALEHLFTHEEPQTSVLVAVAVPVEMIESWLLLIARQGPSTELPRFSRQNSALARRYYHPAAPPPQLKDLRERSREEDGFDNTEEWALHLVLEKLDPSDLANRSPSFALFKQWLDAWPKSSDA